MGHACTNKNKWTKKKTNKQKQKEGFSCTSLTMQSFIVKLAQRIHIRSNSGKDSKVKDTEFFHKTFPYFIWLLRDVTQSIPTDCKDIRDYFLKKVNKKYLQGKVVTCIDNCKYYSCI